MGELSKLLLGARPAEALRIARDTGVLVEVLPEYGPVIGYDLGSARQPGPLEEHLFAVVQETAELGAELSVRLCALLHDLGKPEARPDRRRGSRAGRRGHRRRESCVAFATRTRSATRSAAWWPATRSSSTGRSTACSPGASSPRTGSTGRGGSCSTSEPTSARSASSRGSSSTSPQLERLLEEERESPHRLSHLAIDGNDLIAAGYREGPAIGGALARLLDLVVDDPAVNDRDTLLAEARRWLP